MSGFVFKSYVKNPKQKIFCGASVTFLQIIYLNSILAHKFNFVLLAASYGLLSTDSKSSILSLCSLRLKCKAFQPKGVSSPFRYLPKGEE